MRLDKYLADMSDESRKNVRGLIAQGLVTVNGRTVRAADLKVGPEDEVCLRGQRISYEEHAYYMLCKPEGVVSAVSDRLYATVIDLIDDPVHKDLFPVGRLDVNTSGLLLICNDGELAHRLLSPKKHVDKVYEALVTGTIGQEQIDLFAGGLVISKDWTAMPALLTVLESGISRDGAECSLVRVTIHEGKYHQVRRMFEKTGSHVLSLKRLSMGSLQLDASLAPGQYRPLTEEEIRALKLETGLICD